MPTIEEIRALLPEQTAQAGALHRHNHRIPMAILGRARRDPFDEFIGSVGAPTDRIAYIDPARSNETAGGGYVARDLFGGGTWTSPSGVTAGTVNGTAAMTFDGTSGLFPDPSPAIVVPRDAWTMWAVIKDTSGGGLRRLFGTVDDPTEDEERFSIGVFADSVKIFDQSPATATEVNVPGVLTPGNAHLLTISQSTTEGATVSVDGVVVKRDTSDAAKAALVDDAAKRIFAIGASGTGTGGLWIGSIGQLLILGDDYHIPDAYTDELAVLNGIFMARYGIAAA